MNDEADWVRIKIKALWLEEVIETSEIFLVFLF
jgi:hypothetical protein